MNKLKEVMDLSIENYIQSEIEKRLKKKTVKNVIDDYVRLESILETYSNVMDITPNGIKSILCNIGCLKFDEENKKYVASKGAKVFDDKLYIEKNVAKFIFKLNLFVFMEENNETEKTLKNYRNKRDKILLQAFEMSNAEGKRKLKEFESIRKLLSEKLNGDDLNESN